MDHEEEIRHLGVGRHFGEWWGSKIQRTYGLRNGDKRFSLFNTIRWCEAGSTPKVRSEGPNGIIMQKVLPPCVSLVPELYRGPFDTNKIEEVLQDLISHGSYASPFMNPEGIVIYHVAAGVGFKKTIEGDQYSKEVFKQMSKN